MPVQIEELSSDVSLVEGDLPLTEAQIEKLAKLILKKLTDKQQDALRMKEATKLKRQSSTPFEAEA